jgi:hypothetical protein
VAVLPALEDVKTDLSAFVGSEFRVGEGMYRTDVGADMAFPAGAVKRHTRFQGGIGQDRDEPDSRSKALRQQKAAFPDPAQTGQMGCQLMRENSLQRVSVIGDRGRNRQGLESPVDQPPGHIIGQQIQSAVQDLIGVMEVNALLSRFVGAVVVDDGIAQPHTHGYCRGKLRDPRRTLRSDEVSRRPQIGNPPEIGTPLPAKLLELIHVDGTTFQSIFALGHHPLSSCIPAPPCRITLIRQPDCLSRKGRKIGYPH